MQQWSPEAFDIEAPGTTVVRGGTGEFTPGAPGLAVADPRDDQGRLFRSETGFVDPTAIMAGLSPHERGLVYELVEQDVARGYAERETVLRRELEEARQAELDALARAQEAFAARWREQHDRRLQQIADAAARLAVQLAGKVVRVQAARDPEVLARALETVFYGAGARGNLTVTVNPADAAWLESRADLRERLRIGDLVTDRRIERGGCLVAADGREWDATLEGQLGSLGEIVEDWLTAENAPGDGAKERDDHPVD